MRENKRLFNRLRSEYPNGLSKEQFYKIAHISKSTALYLIQSGKILCTSNGKQTSCYKILTEDILNYLVDRQLHPQDYSLPKNIKEKILKFPSASDTLQKSVKNLSEEQRKIFVERFLEQLALDDELLSVKTVSEITGYSATTLYRWYSQKAVKSFFVRGKWFVPRDCLATFLVSEFAAEIKVKSDRHIAILKNFLLYLKYND